MRVTNNEEFIKKLQDINPRIEPLEEYIRSRDKITCRCKKCGYEWKVTPNKLLSGSNCPNCMHHIKKTQEIFENQLSSRNDTIEVIGKYINDSTKIRCKCKICGNIWDVKPNNLLNGTGCPKCARANISKRQLKSNETFVEEIKKLNKTDYQIIGKYIGSNKKIKCKCNICNNEWETTPTTLLRGSGCPKCRYNKIREKTAKTQEQFESDLARISPDIEIISSYVNSNTKVVCKCSTCGNTWEATPDSLLSGKSRCKICYGNVATSLMEQFLYMVFKKCISEKQVLNRDRTAIGSELDIYIPDYNFAVEVGSWFWHKSIIERDIKKREDCNEKGIRLITVYDAYPFEEPVFDHDCYVYSFDLATQDQYTDLIDLSKKIVSDCGIRWLIKDKEIPELIKKAKISSRRMSHKELEKKIHEIHPSIQLMSQYTRAAEKISCKCLDCEYEWETTSATLLHGEGCPRCAGNCKITKDLFLERLSTINQKIEVIGTYISYNTNIECKCKQCGFIWSPQPRALISGQSCPRCAGNLKFTDEQIREEVAKINNSIEIVGKYVNQRTKIQCKCKICGFLWNTTPDSLLHKHGCPNCARLAKYKTNEQFKSQLSNKHDSIELIGEYINDHTKVHCKCMICGYEWNILPNELLYGNGCRICNNQQRKTQEEFEIQLAAVNSDIQVLGNYVNFDTRIKCKCKICGWIWEGFPSNLLRGARCPKCTGRAPLSRDDFLKRLSNINNNIEVVGDYVNTQTKVECRCKVCGYLWKVIPTSLLRGSCCPKCSGHITKTHEEFLEEISNKNGKVDILSKYVNRSTKVLCKCKTCGYEWEALPSNLVKGVGCPRCAGNISKSHEEFIEELNAKNPNIEVLGEYHNTKLKIECKCKICGYLWNAIPGNLLRGSGCPKCAGNINKTHEQFMSKMSEINSDIEILGTYLNSKTKINCRCKKCGNEWNANPHDLLNGRSCPKCARDKAANKRTKSTEEFKQELCYINPIINVLGEYTGMSKKIECQCLKCGYIWNPFPTNLLRGHGCPNCAQKKGKVNYKHDNLN